MGRNHPLFYCAALPVIALLVGVVIAGYRSGDLRSWEWLGQETGHNVVGRETGHSALADSNSIESERPGWVWWAGLGVGFALGAAFCIPQQRLLHRHRDFVAAQSVRGRARGLGVEVRWLRIVWPMLVAAVLGIGIAWWLAWPAVEMVLGVFGAPIVLYRECRSVQTLARRKAAQGINS